MQDHLDAILEITAAAETIPRRFFRQGVDITHKADESPVTIADRTTEAYIRKAIAQRFPDHGIIGEEFAETATETAYQWIIDPIDGTRAFISGMPLFGMLVALLRAGAPILGVVRMPALGEVYVSNGTVATLNGEPLAAAPTERLSEAMVYINEADKIMRDLPGVFARLNAAGRDRRYAYDCYPHALVAAGHVDGCVDYDLKPYDYLPLVPIVTAAGGVISDWDGQPLGLKSDGRVVSAATPALHRALLDLLHGG